MSELKKNVILKKLNMPYVPIIPLVPPPFVMTMRGYASVFLHDVLKKELKGIAPLQYNPGNEVHDNYNLFDKVNEISCYRDQEELDAAVSIVVTGYCKMAEMQDQDVEHRSIPLKEASGLLDAILDFAKEREKAEKPSFFSRFLEKIQ